MRGWRKILFSIGCISVLALHSICVHATDAAMNNPDANKEAVKENPDTKAAYEKAGIIYEGEDKKEEMIAQYGAASVAQSLDSNLFSTSSRYDRIIFQPEKNGIYFIKYNNKNYGYYDVFFYDLNTKSYKNVYTFRTGDCKLYTTKDAIYYMTGKAASLSEKVTVGDKTYGNTYTVTITKYNLITGKTSETVLDAIYCNGYWSNFVSCIGVDTKGRMYVATNEDELLLYDRQGKCLSKQSYTGKIYEFYGFDATNGNFYYNGKYNWRYWGYDHYMASLMAGNVDSNNKISLPEANLSILYQMGFFTHQQPVTMLNDKYLAVLTTFSSDTLLLLDSNVYDYTDHTEQSTSINLMNSGVSVSVLNVGNPNVSKLALRTSQSEYENDMDTSSIGPRCALTSDGNRLIVKTDDCSLTEYDIAGKTKISEVKTTHPVYTFAMYGNQCVAIEKENNAYYIETIEWTYPTDYSVMAPATMQVGDCISISNQTDSSFVLDYTYESSDPNTVSVDKNGKLLAWKKGSAAIKVHASPINVDKTLTITVVDSVASANTKYYSTTATKGKASGNMHNPEPTGYYGNTISSYLTQLSDGGYERVEFLEQKVWIETYNSAFGLVKQKSIKPELPLIGGFFSGEQYNFVVYGQFNSAQSDSMETFRIVKYDKAWNRVGACSVYGANTYEPFDAGGLSMAEKNGTLYVHTCHTMYAEDDGLHHQANCTFCVQQSDMQLIDSYSGVMNLSYGYVSHSFMQFVKTDDTYVYRVDLGDAYPRGIAYTATKMTDKIRKPSAYGTVKKFSGSTGDNWTGNNLSGMELSDDYCLIVGCGNDGTYAVNYNTWVVSVDKEKGTINENVVTAHSKKDNASTGQPKLVKLNNNQFLLMWEKYSYNKKTEESGGYVTKMVLLNPNGELASAIYHTPLALSECPPIVNSEGQVVWYVTNGDSPIFVKINPYQLQKVQETSKNVKLFAKDNTDNLPAKVGTKLKYKKNQYVVTAEGMVAFVKPGTKKITSLSIPAQIKSNGHTYTVSEIKSKAFNGCKKLKKITIGKNIRVIGTKAFYKCTALKKILIPSKVEKIGKNAFCGCKSLKDIRIKTTKLSNKAVGSGAFSKIHSKAVVRVPSKKLKPYKKLLKSKGVKGKKQRIKK